MESDLARAFTHTLTSSRSEMVDRQRVTSILAAGSVAVSTVADRTYATVGGFTLARCAWIAWVTGRSRQWGSSIEKNILLELDLRTSLPLNRWLSTRSMSDHGAELPIPPKILQETPSESTVMTAVR